MGNSGYPFTCPWDTSMTGFALVKRTKGWTWTRNKAEEVAESVVKEWDQYCTGQVYGYNAGEDGEIGSCWGFYGDAGMKYMIEEAKSEIDCHVNQLIKDHCDRLKTQIKNHVPLYCREPLAIQ